MADVGIASRANVSLNNLDEVGEARFSAKQDVITDLNTYVKNTNYATNDIAGVIKVSSANGLAINASSGHLYGATRTATQYNTDGNNILISKGTLENIKEDLVSRAIGDVTLIEGAEQWL